MATDDRGGREEIVLVHRRSAASEAHDVFAALYPTSVAGPGWLLCCCTLFPWLCVACLIHRAAFAAIRTRHGKARRTEVLAAFFVVASVASFPRLTVVKSLVHATVAEPFFSFVLGHCSQAVGGVGRAPDVRLPAWRDAAVAAAVGRRHLGGCGGLVLGSWVGFLVGFG